MRLLVTLELEVPDGEWDRDWNVKNAVEEAKLAHYARVVENAIDTYTGYTAWSVAVDTFKSK